MKREDEIRARLEKATPGPWKVYEKKGERLIGSAYDHPQLKAPSPVVTDSYHIEHGHQVYMTQENAEFIANAPTDIDYLLKENQRLREALEVANDCLFGNTYGDRVLEEAYQVVSQALHPKECDK